MYIIKGKYKSGDVYFVDFYTDPNTNLNVIGRKITEIIKGRQIENSYTCKEYRLTITKQ